MVVWNIWLQMEQEEKNVPAQSLSKRWSLLAWFRYKQKGSLNLPPPHGIPNYNTWVILWPRGCQHHSMSEPCSLHAFFFLALIYSPSTATLHGRTPHPNPSVWNLFQTHVENVWSACPLSLGFLFSFPFDFLKSNPQNLKYFEFCLTAICEDASLHTQVQ